MKNQKNQEEKGKIEMYVAPLMPVQTQKIFFGCRDSSLGNDKSQEKTDDRDGAHVNKERDIGYIFQCICFHVFFLPSPVSNNGLLKAVRTVPRVRPNKPVLPQKYEQEYFPEGATICVVLYHCVDACGPSQILTQVIFNQCQHLTDLERFRQGAVAVSGSIGMNLSL